MHDTIKHLPKEVAAHGLREWTTSISKKVKQFSAFTLLHYHEADLLVWFKRASEHGMLLKVNNAAHIPVIHLLSQTILS